MSRARRRAGFSSPGSRPACRFLSASSPATAADRRRSARAGRRGTRVLRQRSRRSRWPICSRAFGRRPLHKPWLYWPSDVEGLRSLRESSRVRTQQKPLDGGHEAAVQPEPPARPHSRERGSAPDLRLRPVSQGGQSPEGPLGVARAARAALEASRVRIDDLNVYPVPDGDTGTNMTETVRAVVSALDRDPNADIVRAALMGARGNSGVILSQLVRGAVEGLGDVDEVDASGLARALRGASDAGYAAVRDPQEGTMLTVARALAEKSEEFVPADPPVEEMLAGLVAHGE